MFKISDNLHSSFSNYTNFNVLKIFANETTFAILGTHLWPLSVHTYEITTTYVLFIQEVFALQVVMQSEKVF